jgi:hypothetical protein
MLSRTVLQKLLLTLTPRVPPHTTHHMRLYACFIYPLGLGHIYIHPKLFYHTSKSINQSSDRSPSLHALTQIPTDMDEIQIPPVTLAEYNSQPTAIFAYKMRTDPSPGNKIMHLKTAGETIAYGLAHHASPFLVQGTQKADIVKKILLTYLHKPDRVFQVTAADAIHVTAPATLDFTVKDAKWGTLHYVLDYIPHYLPKQAHDSTDSIYSVTVNPTQTDASLSLTDPDGIVRCYTEQAKEIGFTVTRWGQGKTPNLRGPANVFYFDQKPEFLDAALLKKFKTMHGPTGALMKVHFHDGFFEIYPSLCRKCLTNKKHDCVCDKAKRGNSSTTDDKEAKRARIMAGFEDAFAH